MSPINLLLLLDWNLDYKNIEKRLGFSFHKVTSSKLKKKVENLKRLHKKVAKLSLPY